MSPVCSVNKTQTQNQVLSAVSGMHYSCRQLSLHAYSCPMRRRWRTLRVEEIRWPTPNSRSLQVLKFYSSELLIEATPPPHLSTGKPWCLPSWSQLFQKCSPLWSRTGTMLDSLPPPTALACILQTTVVWAEIVFDTRPSAHGAEFWKCRVNGAFKILPLIHFCSHSKPCTKVVDLQSSTLV